MGRASARMSDQFKHANIIRLRGDGISQGFVNGRPGDGMVNRPITYVKHLHALCVCPH